MSIDNINNLPNLDNSVNRAGTNASTNASTNPLSSSALANGDYNYFSEDIGGPATTIEAKGQLSGTVDDMANAIASHLHLGV